MTLTQIKPFNLHPSLILFIQIILATLQIIFPTTRLIDVYDARDEMTLITELATGGELLDTVTQEKYITEIEVARIIIQGRYSILS